MKLTLLLFLLSAARAAPDAAVDRLLNHIVAREQAFLERMKLRAPLVETYIQESSLEDSPPDNDHYFLGRLRLGDNIGYEKLIEHSDGAAKPSSKHGGAKNPTLSFLPRG